MRRHHAGGRFYSALLRLSPSAAATTVLLARSTRSVRWPPEPRSPHTTCTEMLLYLLITERKDQSSSINQQPLLDPGAAYSLATFNRQTSRMNDLEGTMRLMLSRTDDRSASVECFAVWLSLHRGSVLFGCMRAEQTNVPCGAPRHLPTYVSPCGGLVVGTDVMTLLCKVLVFVEKQNVPSWNFHESDMCQLI